MKLSNFGTAKFKMVSKINTIRNLTGILVRLYENVSDLSAPKSPEGPEGDFPYSQAAALVHLFKHLHVFLHDKTTAPGLRFQRV
jgi:hypothetical protein